MTKNPAISPTQEQSAAITSIVQWYGDKHQQEYYLAGYAGVGKSTLVEIAIEEIKSKHKVKRICTAAYTGKAASVLRKKGNPNAQTIHSLIYKPKVDKRTGELEGFALDTEGEASEAHLIVIDEVSMCSEELARDLRSFNKKILVIGDPAQLPPVEGQGAFTNREPDMFLREIHRQAAESPILELATLARQGLPLPMGYKKGNVQILPLNRANGELIHMQNTQVICGLNRVRWTITQRIRGGLLYDGNLPEVGERIICCQNNREKGIFNGLLGKLVKIKPKFKGVPGAIEIEFAIDDEDRAVKELGVDPHLFDNHFTGGTSKKIPYVKGRPRLNLFDWSAAITAHKAQGSSWDHITIIDDSASFRDNRANWLYTALTRAETGLTLLVRPS